MSEDKKKKQQAAEDKARRKEEAIIWKFEPKSKPTTRAAPNPGSVKALEEGDPNPYGCYAIVDDGGIPMFDEDGERIKTMDERMEEMQPFLDEMKEWRRANLWGTKDETPEDRLERHWREQEEEEMEKEKALIREREAAEKAEQEAEQERLNANFPYPELLDKQGMLDVWMGHPNPLKKYPYETYNKFKDFYDIDPLGLKPKPITKETIVQMLLSEAKDTRSKNQSARVTAINSIAKLLGLGEADDGSMDEEQIEATKEEVAKIAEEFNKIY